MGQLGAFLKLDRAAISAAIDVHAVTEIHMTAETEIRMRHVRSGRDKSTRQACRKIGHLVIGRRMPGGQPGGHPREAPRSPFRHAAGPTGPGSG